MPMTIGEVASRAGLRTSAIRYYESAGLLPRPPRRSGRRVYGESVLDRLALVALARSAGFTIAEIRTLLHGFGRETPPPARWRRLTDTKIRELTANIDRERAMLKVLRRLRRCECPTLSDCAAAIGAAPR